MRKELRELKDIDSYLLGELPAAEMLVFRARLLLSADLRKKLKLQARAHQLIRWYGRDLQRERLATIHTKLMAEENFSQLITSVFK